MRLLLVAAVLLLVAMPVQATIYKWVDRRGTINFTEDLGQVPPEYRSRAVVVDEGAPPAEVIEVPEAGKVKEKGTTPAQAAQEQKKPKMYGGKDVATWKKEFAEAKWRLRSAEDDLAALRNRLTDTSNMSRPEYLGIQMSIKNDEARVSELREKLDALKKSADEAGVPAEARD